MLYKEVKEYSKRQRINLNKSDGFTPGDKVVIFSEDDFYKYKENILNLQDQLRTTENKLYNIREQQKNQDQNLKQIIKDVTAPIYENHQKEIEKKNDKIDELELQIKALQQIASNFNIQMGGLSAMDILFRKKHKLLIEDFNNNIWIIDQDKQVEDVDLKLPANEDQEK